MLKNYLRAHVGMALRVRIYDFIVAKKIKTG